MIAATMGTRGEAVQEPRAAEELAARPRQREHALLALVGLERGDLSRFADRLADAAERLLEGMGVWADWRVAD
jgi:hypothetical protein